MSNQALKVKTNAGEQSVKSQPSDKNSEFKPFISAETILPEITLRGVLLGIILAMVLAGANAYLAMKVGSTITGCIPAAILSIVLLRNFKNSNILENNMVQTIASAGEALTAGVVFTLPALVMMGFWQNFHFWETVLIAVTGGVLGVLFSVPLRRTFIVQSRLRYPEGVATAEVLKSGEGQSNAAGIRNLMFGGLLSAVFKFMQTGLQICADIAHKWVTLPTGTTFGIGTGLSSAMIGAGFVIGYKACLAMLVGGGITWLVGIPLYTTLYGAPEGKFGFDAAMAIWASKMRFVGVGTFIVGGFWTAFSIAKPIQKAIASSLESIKQARLGNVVKEIRTERDIPMNWVLVGTVVFAIPVFIACYYILSSVNLGLSDEIFWSTIAVSTVFSLVVGFLCSCISSYMTGIVGSSHNPLSGVTLMGVVIISTVLYFMLGSSVDFSQNGISIAAMIMMITAIVCCAAAIAGDNLQDLKTGQIVGSTPWKQQAMLMIGVIAGALAIAPVLQVLYEAYGLTGALPRPDMNPTNVMSAPKAALMSDVIKGIFTNTINWTLYGIGAAIGAAIIFVDSKLKASNSSFRLPVLAVAIGIYLPYDVTTAALIGGLISLLVEKKAAQSRKGLSEVEADRQTQEMGQRGLLYAAGLIAGEAIMGVLLAVPFALYQSNSMFRFDLLASNEFLTMTLGGGLIFAFSYHFYKSSADLSK